MKNQMRNILITMFFLLIFNYYTFLHSEWSYLFHCSFLIKLPIIYLFILIFLVMVMPSEQIDLMKEISLYMFFLIFMNYITIFTFVSNFGYRPMFYWKSALFDFFNLNLNFAIDNMNMFFLLLVALLFPMCLLMSWESVKTHMKEYIIVLAVLELFLLLTFLSYNLFFFYFFFECTLMPMFLLMGVWGSSQRKIHAVYQYFFYTVFGSIFLLIGMMTLYYSVGSLNLDMLFHAEMDFKTQLLIWFCLFVGFCMKMPMFPFHIWLPEAHVEAPTSGSVILAGVLLKVGSYGMLSFIMPVLPSATIYFSPAVFILCILSMMYISIMAISQTDMKKIMAYSSMAHMNFVVLGMFSLNAEGMMGSMYMMLSHGMVSSALFICISVIYDSYHSSLLTYYSGLVFFMPLYSSIFFTFILANMSFPMTSNFMAELLVLMGLFENNFFVSVVSCFSMILGAIYSMWLMNSILFGLKKNPFLMKFSDFNSSEAYVLILLVFLTFFFGIYPNTMLEKIEFMSNFLLSSY